MESALEDVERLSLIVKSLLALHQAESGRQPLELSTVDLSEIACAIVSHFEQPAAEKRVSLRTEVPLGIFARLDRAQVERLISNLVSNAVKYTHPGTEVRVALAERPGGVEIAVSDRGPGIPAQHLPHIFERFYRVPLPGDGAKGMGLGLTFVDSIVRAHGGAIEIRPREGGGTEFVVTLPQAAPAQPAATGLSGIEAT
jgi:signal transduction histidine kinase